MMSSPRVLVGLAAERTSLLSLVPQRNYGSSAWNSAAGAGLRSRAAVAQLPLTPGRRLNFQQPSSPSRPRPFHTTAQQLQHQRRPRTFHLTDPQLPTIHPHSSSSSSSSATTDTAITTTDQPPLPLPEQLRAIMRLLTHPVVVCTATHPASSSSDPDNNKNTDPASGKGTPRAMTMSSFTSLALRPTPLVSFNVAVPSRTHDAVAASRAFNVHVLADDAAGARVADWFARGNDGGRGEVFERLVEEGGLRVVESDNGAAAAPPPPPPVLRGDGVLYVLRCRLLDDEPARGLVRVRDHVIVLGEVLEIVEGSGAMRDKEGRFGLLYADRRYRQLGGCITPEVTEEGAL